MTSGQGAATKYHRVRVALTAQLFSHSSGGWEVQYQDAGGLFPAKGLSWLPDGHLLAISD